MTKPPIVKSIDNSVASANLHVTELVDPNRVKFYAESLADQINTFRLSYSPPKKVHDLSAWIADILIETTVQGSSLLEVHVIDPAWTLLMRDKNGVSFIDVDDEGYLWPPVEVTFPKDVSDSTWRLCQVRPSTSLTEANLIMVFEDKIVAELREQHGAQVSNPNETRAEFLQRLVKQTNEAPAYPAEVDIRFLALLPAGTFDKADLTMSQRTPTSAKQKHPGPARKNPNKHPHKAPGTDPLGLPPFPNPVQLAVSGVAISIQDGYNAFVNGISDVFVPGSGQLPTGFPVGLPPPPPGM